MEEIEEIIQVEKTEEETIKETMTTEEQNEKKTIVKEKQSTSKIEESYINKKRRMGENIDKILSDEQIKELEKKKKKQEKLKDKKRGVWYVSKVNSNIYVQGLPKNVTENELVEYFVRCGFIRKDQRTGNYKIKLYKDKDGNNKGDALISFLREESVAIAIDMLNESEIRPGYKISVEKAKFEQKGDYKKREAYKLDEIQRFKLKTEVDRMLGWNEEDDEKGLKIVILKNMFAPSDFFDDPGLHNDLELDIIEECQQNFGEIDKFKIFEEHPEGVIKIRFHNPVSAENTINALNGRFYNGRKIEAAYWDGKTDYSKFQEDENSQNQRIDEFGKWLETQEEEKNNTINK